MMIRIQNNFFLILLSVVAICVQSANWASADAAMGVERADGVNAIKGLPSTTKIVATYAVSVRGFDAGKVDTTTVKNADVVSIETHTRPSKLVALFVDARQSDHCQFRVHNNQSLEPLHYRSVRAGAKGFDRSITYDLVQHVARYDSGEEVDLPTMPVLDNCNFHFAVAQLLAMSDPPQEVSVLDAEEGRVRSYKIKAIESDEIEFDGRMLDCKRITLQRSESKNRTITFWLALEYPDVPVKIESQRKGRITRLILDSLND